MTQSFINIKEFPDYDINSSGQVKSNAYRSKNKILKQQKSVYGYMVVCLYKNKKMKVKSVARLVAEYFIRKPKIKEQVNHKNGIKTDNRVENLEWCTQKENIRHSWLIGLCNPPRGSKRPNSKLTEEKIKKIRESLSKQSEIAKKYGIDQSLVSRIKNNKRWSFI